MAELTDVTPVGLAVGTATDAPAARAAFGYTDEVVVSDHGAVGDAVGVHSAGTTAGSAVVTSPSSQFTADMVGKTIVVAGANADDTALVTTVASFESAGQITMAAPATKVSPLIRVNVVVGTDNSAAFAAAFAEAAELMTGPNPSIRQWQNIKPVSVPPGNYLTLTGVPALQKPGHILTGSGSRSSQIWHCGSGPFLSMGIFNVNPGASFPYYNSACESLKISHVSLHAPICARDADPARRVGIGIQDNGAGHLFVEHAQISGFDYGIFGTAGSDFTEIGSNVTITDCNVGIYFGPGSQQISMNGPIIIGRNGEGIVAEGARNAVLTGLSLGDSTIADVVFESPASGVTRAGHAYTSGGIGPWQFLNCWFESASAGSDSGQGPQHILIDSQRDIGIGKTEGWEGIAFRDCLLISGGTQTPGGTRAFIHDKSKYPANPTLSNFSVVGRRINAIYRYSGPAASFSPVIEGGFLYYPSDIAMFMGPSGVVPVGTNLRGVVTSPTRLTLSGADISSTTITGATINTPTINTPTITGGLVQTGVLKNMRSLGILPEFGNAFAVGFGGPGTSVNYMQLTSAAPANAPRVFAMGSDTNINIQLVPKGAGVVQTYDPVTFVTSQLEVKGHTHTVAQVTGAESTANKNAANGYCPLDAASKVPVANLPARWVAVPASATAPGAAGDVAYNATHMFVCVAANTWTWVKLTNTWPPA
jgi:hypothetical protein